MANEKPKDVIEELAEIERSEFERAVGDMTPEQLDHVTRTVQAEAERRDDPFKRLGHMPIGEARDLVRRKFGYEPQW